VDFFRALLEADADELPKLLAGRSPENQQRVLAKLREYESLPPDERELRLRATELQWYLVPLLSLSGTNRQARLAQVPADIRKLVEERLTQWNLLPPPLQREVLENDRTLSLYLQLDAGTPAQKMPDKERQKTIARAYRFFELTPEERAEVLGMLSDTERQQMEKTLRAFQQLTPEQRARCIRAFGRFATMSAEEQQQLLKNARRWQAMTPAERQAWRDLVRQVPIWPPEPPGMNEPPLPPFPPSFVSPAVTNGN